MVALPKKRWTAKEYLTFEAESEERHDFVDGEIYSMTGASEKHNLIMTNLIITVGSQLRKRPCKLYPSDMLVETAQTGDYHYPDISVVCGEAEIKHDKRDILVNPTLIIKVLSPSTEAYDRGKKFQNYQTLGSLQEYVLIAQDEARTERYLRQSDDQWLYSKAAGLEATIELSSIGCALTLADVYDKVTFEEA